MFFHFRVDIIKKLLYTLYFAIKNMDDYMNHFKVGNEIFYFYDINSIKNPYNVPISAFPVSIKILLEGIVRNLNGTTFTEEHLSTILNFPETAGKGEIPFLPTRVLLQDYTGVPAFVDMAAFRDALNERGIDPSRVNSDIPAHLVVDHSVHAWPPVQLQRPGTGFNVGTHQLCAGHMLAG